MKSYLQSEIKNISGFGGKKGSIFKRAGWTQGITRTKRKIISELKSKF